MQTQHTDVYAENEISRLCIIQIFRKSKWRSDERSSQIEPSESGAKTPTCDIRHDVMLRYRISFNVAR